MTRHFLQESISADTMQESPFYQEHFKEVIQRGVQQGIE